MTSRTKLLPIAVFGEGYAADSNRAVDAYIEGLRSPSSRRGASLALKVIAEVVVGDRACDRSVPWHLIREEHMIGIRRALAERYAPGSANVFLSVLRRVLTESWRQGLIKTEDYKRAVAVAGVEGESRPRGRLLRSSEVRALFDACAADPNRALGARDAAIVAVLYHTGMRRFEVAALSVRDYDHETGVISVRGSRKGRSRNVNIGGGASTLLEWLKLRGAADGPLFVPVRRGGHLEVRQISGQHLTGLLRTRARGAGIGPVTPDDLRRSMVNELLEAGKEVSAVQHMVGHRFPSTTRRFNRRGKIWQ